MVYDRFCKYAYSQSMKQMDLAIPYYSKKNMSWYGPSWKSHPCYAMVTIDCNSLNIPDFLMKEVSEPIESVSHMEKISLSLMKYLRETRQKALIWKTDDLPIVMISEWADVFRIFPTADEIKDVLLLKPLPENQ